MDLTVLGIILFVGVVGYFLLKKKKGRGENGGGTLPRNPGDNREEP